jgi:cytochrome b
MTITNNTIEAGGATRPATVKVWDPVVRVLHWSLVGYFTLAYATGEDLMQVHVIAGYTVAALLALRIVWGLIGPHQARFRNFVRPPRQVLSYLQDLARRDAPRHLGHNPAGAAMIVSVLLTLISTCATGIMMTTNAFGGAGWMEGLHEALANLAVGLVLLHVLGVLVTSLRHRENLVIAMITGRKRR